MLIKNKKNQTGRKCFFGCGERRSDWRISLFMGIILMAVIVITARLYVLQVSSHESFQALADSQHTLSKDLVPKRGEIFFRDKSGLFPAAVNRGLKMAFAVPNEIEDKLETARRVSEILQLDRMDVQDRLSRPNDMYEVLKHKLTDEEADAIVSLKAKGIYLTDEYFRYYPSGELASNVLGFVGWRDENFSGRYGIESYFEDELKGVSGEITQNRDASGRWISTGIQNLVKAKDGDSLVLTIDHAIQYEAEKILSGSISKNDADSGSIVVLEAKTGKVLAMAINPTFDPNKYAETEDLNSYRNTIVSDAYESGSVFKPLLMAAALDSELVNPNTTYTDTGIVKEAGYSIRNSDLKSNGVQTMTQVLEKSLNTGVIYVEKLLGNKNFAEYVKRFGFGEQTGIGLISEASGNLNNLKNLRSDIQFFTASFGQGISVTPIQLVSAYGAIANKGILMKPQIIDKIVHADGSSEVVQPQEVRRVISENASKQAAQMLRSVVVNGHGKRADVPGYAVVGKTGTAQVANQGSRGYADGINIGSFAGFAPEKDPMFVILVRMDNPKSVEWAESSAAPAFGELMKFILEYYNIEPTEEYTQKNLDDFNASHDLKKYFLEKTEKDKLAAEADENSSAKKDETVKKKSE
jgi:cell division protein FtsI/penicillin-binding protein 2